MSYPKANGTISIHRENPSTIFVRMVGDVTGALVAQKKGEFSRILGESPTPYWLFVLDEITGFDAAAVSSGGEWWRAFKAQQGSHVFFVTTLGAARMAASALGFSVGLRLIACTSLSEARSQLALLPIAGRA